MGHTVSIKVRYNDFKTVSRQKRLDSSTDQERVIYDTSVLLWNKLMRDALSVKQEEQEVMGATPKPKFDNSILEVPVKPIRLLGVTVSGLSTEGIVQDDLFSIEADEKDEKLSIVLDSLASKFGEGAIMSGALWRRAHGDGGERRKRSELKAEIDLDNEE